MYFFYYEVDYYDDGERTETGITASDEMEDAVAKIVDYYGREQIEKLTVEYTGDNINVLPVVDIDKSKLWKTDTKKA